MENVVGRPVQGDNFFDRRAEIARIWRHLSTDNVLLLAPRRVGKTSVMYRLAEQAHEKGFVAAYLTIEGAESELDVVERIFHEVEKLDVLKKTDKIKRSGVGDLLRRIRKVEVPGVGIEIDAATAPSWNEVGDTLLRALAESGVKTLFLVDEVPVFLLRLFERDPTGARAAAFLHWFREVRIDRLLGDRVRWLLAGSIGLDTVARRLRLTRTINDLFVVNDLGAFSETVALDFLDHLASAYNTPLDMPTKERLLGRVGWLLPYYLQLLFSELLDDYRDEGLAPSPEAVDKAYERLLGKGSYFEHWVQRLKEELGTPDDRKAIQLLNAIARDDQGASSDNLELVLLKSVVNADEREHTLQYLLDLLENDGYIVREGDRFRFRSSLLREFWLRRVAPKRSSTPPSGTP